MIDPFESLPNEGEDPFELNAEMPTSILSPSSISTYLRCPEQFRREYVLKEKRGRGAWAVSGTAFHKARHAALSLQAAGEVVTEDRLLELYAAGWEESIGEGHIDWRGTAAEDQREIGWGMTSQYHQELGRTVVPIRMEFGAKTNVDGVPVPIYGRIDVETEPEIIDTKTGRQLKHKLPEEWYVQGMIYVLITGKPIRWHVVSEKPACTTSDVLRVVPKPKVLESAARIARHAYDGIIRHLREYGADNVWTGAGMATGACKYCSFKNRCAHIPD